MRKQVEVSRNEQHAEVPTIAEAVRDAQAVITEVLRSPQVEAVA